MTISPGKRLSRVLWAGAAIVAFFAAALLIVSLPPVQQRALSAIERAVSDNLAARVSIGSLHTNFIDRVVLKRVVLAGDGGHGDSVSVRRVRVRIGIAALLRRTVDLRRIDLDGVHAYCFRDTGGALHAPFLPRPRKAAKPRKHTRPWTVAIDSIVTRRLDARYADAALAIDARLNGIKANVHFFALDSLSVRLVTGPGEALTPWWRGPIGGLNTGGTVSRSGLVLDRVELRGDSVAVDGRGTIAFRRTGVWDLDVSAYTSRNALCVLDPVKPIGRGGVLRATARWQGSRERPRLTVRAFAFATPLGGISIDSLAVNADYAPGGELRGDVRAAAPIGSMHASVNIQMPGLMIGPSMEGYRASLSLDLPALSPVLHRFGVSVTLPDAAVSLSGFAQGRSFTALPDSAAIDALLRENGASAEGNRISVVANISSGAWVANIADRAGNTVQANGTLIGRDSLHGDLKYGIPHPEAITRYFIKESTGGSIAGTAVFSGPISQPSIAAIIAGDQLAWNGVVVEKLRGSVSFSQKKVHIDTATIETSGDLGTLLSRFGIKEIAGNYSVTAAASGPLPLPAITARLAVDSLNARSVFVPRLECAASFCNDTLYWQDLRLLSDSASIKSTGSAGGVIGPDRFIAATITAKRKGRPNGSAKAALTLRNDTVGGKVSLSSFSTALLAPWTSTPIPVDASITLKSTIAGALRNPAITLSFNISQAAGDIGAFDYHTQATLNDSTLRATIDALAGGIAQPLRVTVEAPLSFRTPWNVKQGIRDGARVRAQCDHVGVAGLLKTFFPVVSATGSISLDAEAIKRAGVWTLSGNGAARINGIRDTVRDLSLAALSLDALFDGTENGVAASVRFAGSNARWQGRRIDSLYGYGRYTADSLFLDSLGIRVAGAPLRLAASVPVASLSKAKAGNGAKVVFSGEEIPLAPLGLSNGNVSVIKGTLSTNGTLILVNGAPSIRGLATVRGAKVQLLECEPPIGPIDAEVLLAGDSITVRMLSAKLGQSGRIKGNGYARLGKQHHARMALYASDLRLRCADLDAGVKRARLQVTDSANLYVVGGDIDLADTRYSVYFSFNTLLDRVERPAPPPLPPNPFLQSVALRTMVTLDRNLTIETNIGRFVLDGKVAIVGTLDRPGAIGTIEIAEGYVYYLDRRFTIDRGTFRLQDPGAIKPRIDLEAVAQVTAFMVSPQDNEVDNTTYDITLRIVGTLDKPEVILSADPPLQPVQIVSLLTFGTIQGGVGTDISARLESLLKQQLAGLGTRKLEQWLNIESLNIEPIGNNDAVVTAVKRLTPRLTVSYRTNIDSLGLSRGTASYRLLPFLYIDGTGTQNDIGANLRVRWSR
jgi:autotransporter translocation and assembly factor TamB